MSREGHETIPILAVPFIIGLKFFENVAIFGRFNFRTLLLSEKEITQKFLQASKQCELKLILARCLTIFVSKADKISLTGSFDFRSVIHLSSLYECAAMKKLERSRLQERNKYEKEILSFSLMYLSG